MRQRKLMKNRINGTWYISTTVNGKIIDLSHAQDYGKYLEVVLDISPITIKNYLGSLEKFWIWSLAVKVEENESFELYLAKYRQELKQGFEIFDFYNNERLPILQLKPKSQSSIDNDLSNLSVFLKWFSHYHQDINLYKNTINWNYEFNRRLNNKHSSYISQNINRQSLDRILKKNTVIKKPKKRIMAIDKAFPFQYFLELIENSKTREKLIYLLLGGTSARISQVLNLTIHDIDYETYNVYLSDPTLDDERQKGYLGVTRKKWLLEKYHIDAKEHYPHNTIQFKYPIPSRPNKPLFWINEEIKYMFFEILAEYTIIPEHSRYPRHPFFFTKKNGDRLLYRPVYNKFKKDYASLIHKYKELEFIGDLPLHSLRHMWGNYMAELYYLASLKKIPAEAEKIRLYTQYGMGHSDSNSTDIYFNAKMDEIIQAGSEYFVHYIRESKHLPTNLYIQGLYNEN